MGKAKMIGGDTLSNEIFENLKKAIIEYDSEGAASLAKEAMKKKIDPMKALDATTEGIRQGCDVNFETKRVKFPYA
jgi:methanogenic corrinoid protein MtbC1